VSVDHAEQEGVSAVSLDQATLRAMAEMSDEVGVLSAYVTLDPQARAEPAAKPPWELRLRHSLAQQKDRLKETGSRTHYAALTDRLERLRLDIERLLDPAAPGQGRALFAGVSDGQVRTVSLQVPLVDRVVVEPQAHLRPLVAAWSAAGPAGVAAVSADEVRVIDLRFGWVEEVATVAYEPTTGESRQLKGPAAANPAMAQHSAPQHDLFERREEDKLLRYLRTVGPRLATISKEREWEHLVITGEAHLVQAVTEGLPHGTEVEVVTLSHPVATLTPPKIAATVEQALDAARQRRRRGLAEKAHDAAMSANAGAWGLGETLDGLQQGRVSHLLLHADGQWAGSRTPEGLLVPAGEVPPGADADTMSDEPYLGERMIELAFRNGGRVTMLDAEDSAPLVAAGGVAALLRW
jgi:hypothetical protein